jgi:hypothetical protein
MISFQDIQKRVKGSYRDTMLANSKTELIRMYGRRCHVSYLDVTEKFVHAMISSKLPHL